MTESPKNRLKILINEIAVKADNMKLVNEIVEGLAIECDVVQKSVRRWMNNGSQPTSVDLSRIILYLNRYNPEISYTDFFEKNVSEKALRNVSHRTKLIK